MSATSDIPAGYHARVCLCSHPEGAHNSGRPHPLRAVRGGVCLYPGCDCRTFTPDDGPEAA